MYSRYRAIEVEDNADKKVQDNIGTRSYKMIQIKKVQVKRCTKGTSVTAGRRRYRYKTM